MDQIYLMDELAVVEGVCLAFFAADHQSTLDAIIDANNLSDVMVINVGGGGGGAYYFSALTSELGWLNAKAPSLGGCSMFTNRPAMNKEVVTPERKTQNIKSEQHEDFAMIRDAVQRELLENSNSDVSVNPERLKVMIEEVFNQVLEDEHLLYNHETRNPAFKACGRGYCWLWSN